MRYLARVHIDTSLTVHSKYDETTTAGGDFVATIPNTYTFGMKIDFFNTVLLVTDYSYAKWTDYDYKQENTLNTNDRFKLSMGIEYLDRKHPRRTFWKKFPLRLGATYGKLQYLVEGKEIYYYAASFGIGIPMNDKDIIDLALTFGKRGPNDGTLVQEKFVSLGISLSFGEQWFIRKGYK